MPSSSQIRWSDSNWAYEKQLRRIKWRDTRLWIAWFSAPTEAMSYSGYAAWSAQDEQNGHVDPDTSSGNMGLLTRHTRMMGKIKTTKPPQRLFTPSSSSSCSSSSSSASFLRVSSLSSGFRSTSSRGRPVPFALAATPDPALARKEHHHHHHHHHNHNHNHHSQQQLPEALPPPQESRPARALSVSSWIEEEEETLGESTEKLEHKELPGSVPPAVLDSARSFLEHSPPSLPVLKSRPLSELRLGSRPSQLLPTEQESRSSNNAPVPPSKSRSASPAAPAVDKTGQNVLLVNDHPYTILKKIGKGGSSVVYEVFDEERNLRAIKCVDLSEADAVQAESYINEIHLLEQLQGHDRIIRLFEYEHRKTDDLLFVVMERGDTDLATLLKKKSSISDVQRRFYWAEMLEAVQVIHSAGVIHSDLKPANFLMVAGNLKLIDFGIATSIQSDKTSVIKDNQFGTFNFISPEALQDLSTDDSDSKNHKPKIKISFKTDVWSLGVILYHLTYRRLPFAEFKQPWKKLQAIVDPDYNIKYPDCSDPLLLDTIRACLVRNPSQRASVKELLSHDYLKGSAQPAAEAPPIGKENLSTLFHELSDMNVLTPNTKLVLTRAMSKLPISEAQGQQQRMRKFEME